MNKAFRFLMVSTILLNAGIVTAENSLHFDSDEAPTRIIINVPHRCPKHHHPAHTSYNTTSTELSVAFPSDGQGGKVEIYRNGSLVVSANATADTSLSYVLRNYGTGNYTVIVSCANTVVYSNSLEIKQ
jgi:hypothetical protein